MKAILIWMTVGIYLTAAGAFFMGYEQYRANSGFFVSLPTPEDRMPQDHPKPFEPPMREY